MGFGSKRPPRSGLLVVLPGALDRLEEKNYFDILLASHPCRGQWRLEPAWASAELLNELAWSGLPGGPCFDLAFLERSAEAVGDQEEPSPCEDLILEAAGSRTFGKGWR